MRSDKPAIVAMVRARCAAMLLAVAATIPGARAEPFALFQSGTGTASSGVTVVDVATNRAVGDVHVGPASSFAVDPYGHIAYVGVAAYDAGKWTPSVAVVDVSTLSVIGRFPLPILPDHLALSEDGTTLYVLGPVCSNGCTDRTEIVVLDAGSGHQADVVDLGDGTGALGLVVDHASRRAYVSAMVVTGSVRAIDLDTHGVLARIPVGSTPTGMALDRARGRLYVMCETGFAVDVIDTSTNTIVSTIPAPWSSFRIALTPDGSRLVVTANNAREVRLYDTGSGALVKALPLAEWPNGVQVTPDGQWAYVARTGKATAIRMSDFQPVADIPIAGLQFADGRFIGGYATPVSSTNSTVLTGLWWDPSQPGWGMQLAQHGNRVFAAWFTYDGSGGAKWYTSSDCSMSPPLACPDCVREALCSGTLYESNGPAFFSGNFPAGAVQTQPAGLLQILFHGRDNASVTWALAGGVQGAEIERQVFGSAQATGYADYTDLWFDAAAPGWGLGITEQGRTMFVTWYVYDDGGAPSWIFASNCTVKAGGNGCSGTLYRASGPAGPASGKAFDTSKVKAQEAGSIDIAFTDRNNGVVSYTVDGRSGTKSVTRQPF